MDFSPKANFLKGPNVAPWGEVTSSKLFLDAVGTAMLQMQANLGLAKGFDESSANNFKMEGARIFLAIMMNLSTPPEETAKSARRDNLDHKL